MSALTGEGLRELWETVIKHRDVLTAAGMSKPDIALVMLRVESLREMIIA